MATTQFPNDISVAGDINLVGNITPNKSRTNLLAMTELAKFPIPLTSFRVWTDMAALLPSAGATDDLGLVEGTFGTATPTLQTEDLQDAGATNNRARVLVQLPWEYVAGNTVQLRFMAGMITNVADNTATLDCEAYKQQDDPDDAIGADLVSTGETTMNSKTFANIDFVVTATSLSPGDILDVRITTAVNDASTSAEVIAAISYAQLLCDVR